MKLHKTVDSFILKSVLFIKWGGGCICNSKSCFSVSGVLVGSELMDSTDFIIQRSTVLRSFNNFNTL